MDDDNKRACDDAKQIQQETIEALIRTKQQAADAELAGITTLEGLNAHREKLDQIMASGDRLHEALTKTENLQNRLGRWGLKSTWRGARKEVEAERSLRERQNSAKAEREERICKPDSQTTQATIDTVDSSSGSDVVITKKKKKGWALTKRRSSKEKPKEAAKTDLMVGISDDDPLRDDFEEMAATDKVVDGHLDDVNDQLDVLLQLSNTIKSETARQDLAIEEVQKQMDTANEKQKIANSRARRFMTGKLRSEHDKQKTLFGVV